MDEIEDFVVKDFNMSKAGHVYGSIIGHIEKAVIIKALEYSEGNQIQAAEVLGVHRNTLRHKIRKLKIDVGRYKQ
ncbi:MAG: helix-turn-helix domain-containing protein [Candidatus Omnitrophota bacterium]